MHQKAYMTLILSMQGQFGIIIWTNVVGTHFRWYILCPKVTSLLVLEKKDFKVVLRNIRVSKILAMWPEQFVKFLASLS